MKKTWVIFRHYKKEYSGTIKKLFRRTADGIIKARREKRTKKVGSFAEREKSPKRKFICQNHEVYHGVYRRNIDPIYSLPINCFTHGRILPFPGEMPFTSLWKILTRAPATRFILYSDGRGFFSFVRDPAPATAKLSTAFALCNDKTLTVFAETKIVLTARQEKVKENSGSENPEWKILV